jgi:hypothetical protein
MITEAETAKWGREMVLPKRLDTFMKLTITLQEQGNATITSPGFRLAPEICKRHAETQRKKAELEAEARHSRQHVPATPSSRFDFTVTSAITPRMPKELTPTPQLNFDAKRPKEPQFFDISEWLKSLNGRDPRDRTDYMAFEEMFVEEHVWTTEVILNLKLEGLVGIGVKRAVAIKLIQWATEDRDA